MAKTRITIIGCGSRGRLIATALRSVIADAEIIGHDKNQEVARLVEKEKIVDKSVWNLPASVENAQLIVIAIPQDQVEATLKAIDRDVMRDALVTDLCASKVTALKHANLLPMDVAYISSDIVIAPAESRSKTDTAPLKGAIWTLTPRAGTSSEAIAQLTNIVTALDAQPLLMEAAEHDGLRFAVETLPSAVSFALMNAISGDAAWQERRWLAGDEFAKRTQAIDNRSPADIATNLTNQPEVSLHWLNQMLLQLMALRDAIQKNDTARIETLLKNAQTQRTTWLNDWHNGREKDAPPVKAPKMDLMGLLLGSRLAERLNDNRK